MKKTMKKRKKRSGLGAVSGSTRSRKKGFSFDRIKDELSPVLMITAGVVVGNLTSKLLDKVIKPENQTGIKAAIKPATLLIAGSALKIMTDNRMLKDVGTGIAISGVLSAAKKLDKNGTLMGDFAGLGDPIQIGIPAYAPELPELPMSAFSGDEDEEFSGTEDEESPLYGDDQYQEAIGVIEDVEVDDFV